MGQVAVYQGHDRAYLAGLFNGSREIAAGQTLAPLFMYAAHIPVFYNIGKIQCFHCLFKMWSTDKFLPVFLLVFRKIIPAKVFPCYNLSLIAASSVIPSNNRAVPFHVICYPFLTTQVHMLFAVYRLITQHIRYFSLYLKFFSTAF